MQYHSALTHVPVGLVPWTETAPAPPVRSRGQSQLTSCIHYLVMNEQNPHASLLPTHPLTTPVPPANHHCHPPFDRIAPSNYTILSLLPHALFSSASHSHP